MRKTTYTFDRTPFYRGFVNRLMKKSIKRYNNSDYFISISFSYHPKQYTNKKVFMFCDWTYDYYFKYFKQRKPDFLEMQEINNQHKLQKSVDAMFVLFPDVAKYIKKQCLCENVFYLGNVINSETYAINEQVKASKYKHNKIVFIGSIKYIDGLKVLLKTVKKLSKDFNDISLDVIGITQEQVSIETDENVHFWGYLNKSNEADNRTYYDIVNNAKVFVNTTPQWASFSAVLDVMYHYTPVVTSKYRSFTQTFGDRIDFGYYCSNEVSELSSKIKNVVLMDEKKYRTISLNARKAVKTFDWDNYVDRMISKISDV